MGDEQEFDVVVVGSGGGALTGAYVAAAAGLRTLVIESTELLGGTTAYSGAGLWLPGNQAQHRAGVDDTIEQGRIYLRGTVGDRTPEELQDAFLETGPRMIADLEKDPLLVFEWRRFPDYFSARPGGFPQGRAVHPVDLAGADLGVWLNRLRPTQAADRIGMDVDRTVLAGGQALIARLLLALDATGHATVLTGTAMENLLTDDGVVIGVQARLADTGALVDFRAGRGVLLAAGGFERNDRLRQRYQAPLGSAWTNGGPGSMGRPLEAAMEIGADTDLLDECWWTPGTLFPDGSAVFTLGISGGIVVDSAGQRFMNESLPYDQAGREIRKGLGATPSRVPSYLIFDSRNGGAMPAMCTIPTDPATFLASGVWKQADTLEGLAGQIGVPADALVGSVQRFNGFAATGVDEDFHRGEDAFDKFFATGDGANPAMVPIQEGPYFAATIVLGDLGTKGGLKTDEHARVLRTDGSVIRGLYAAGNTMASVMGACYPGPGSPVGSCMVFSYLAAHDMIDSSVGAPH